MKLRRSSLAIGLSVAAFGCAAPTNRPPSSPIAHVVLVGFKEGTEEATVSRIVEAAHQLPAQIPGFLAFHGGANDSPEGLDKGHSHGFLMTFNDRAALETYGPHPAHQAFGDFARPHRDEVFVFDIAVARPPPADTGNVQHLVFFKYNDDVTAEMIAEVSTRFAALPDKIPGLIGFAAGENLNPGRALDFDYGFIVTFADAAARETYLPHPDHKAFVDFITPLLADVLVVDYTVAAD